MRKIYGKVVVHRKAPDGTGWVRDLYKIGGVPVEVAQHMERVFLHMVDTEAADTLHRPKRASPVAWPIRERDGCPPDHAVRPRARWATTVFFMADKR